MGTAPVMREYDGWWYFGAEERLDKPVIKDGRLIPDNWIPFGAFDNDRLEQAKVDPSIREFPDELVVHDKSCQRMAKVNFDTMTLSPLYWDAPPVPVRRTIWIQMKDDADTNGGNPVPEDWDEVIEKAYQENDEWLHGPTTTETTEKIVDIGEPLANYVLILRQGHVEGARLTLKASLEKRSIFGQSQIIRLIRGYTPYHIAVISALKMTENVRASKSNVDLKPLILPSPFDIPDLTPPEAPKQLLFIVHGIGQKMAGKFGSSFIKDCNSLRDRMIMAIMARGGQANDICMLPVCWRDGLDLGLKSYFTPESEETFEDLVNRVTLDNIPAIRSIASDVGLDIVLYMTPTYFLKIIERVLSEVRRLHEIFKRAAGEGADKVCVSFMGHSLGSAIVTDLISFVTKDLSESNVDALAKEVSNSLGFTVDRFFAVGSPLPMITLLKQLRPCGCVPEIHKLGTEAVEDCKRQYPCIPDFDFTDPRPKDLVFSCRQFYNIFHPYDPIAYRMEPLLVSPLEMSKFTYPLRLPYNKKGALHLKRQMEESVQEWKVKANRAKDDILNSLPDWLRPKSVSPTLTAEDEDQPGNSPQLIASPSTTPHPALLKFNDHGRVDFSIEESLFENAYVSAISSHFSYWEDVDVAAFLVVELLSLPIKPTITE